MLVRNRDSRPSSGSVFISAADGFEISAQVYEPPRRARATALITAGTAIKQTFYAPFARFLAEHGVRVVTFDYRGIGSSCPASLRGFQATLTDWARLDTRAVLAWVKEQFPEQLFLIGHSFGGQLIGILDDVADVHGAIVVAAQLAYVGHWSWVLQARNRFLFQIATPVLTAAYGYLPGISLGGVDLPTGVAKEWARWCMSPDYLLDHVPEARERFARFDRPLLYYSFTDDDYAPARAVDAFLAATPTAATVHRRLAPGDLGVEEIGHFGFFRARFEPTLWQEALAYIDDLSARRPPRARPRRPGTLFEISDDEILADLEPHAR